MTSLSDNLVLLTPEFALAGLAFLVFAADLLLPEGRKVYLAWLSMAGLIALMLVSILMLWESRNRSTTDCWLSTIFRCSLKSYSWDRSVYRSKFHGLRG
ncbi:MAG: hypothetical protein CM1200mP27_12170 [Chloroflexota bacterium]|nr:MAG: hypothetical protein CM1200mP27_12170 [Chloroflexota bacterium]